MPVRTCRPTILVLALLLLFGPALPPALGAQPAMVDPRLWEELAASADGTTTFLVVLREQAGLDGAPLLQDRQARLHSVYQALRETAERSQAGLRADLETWGVPYHSFWILNAIRVTGDAALARRLAGRPEVARLVADPVFDGLDDPEGPLPAPVSVEAVEWNISRVHAPDVWALGYAGQGIVVGSVDTGADAQHPALVNQYRGTSTGSDDYNWHDAFGEYTVPTDPHGHGTHTIGTMVGDDGGSNQIGMAPGAQWIACKVSSGSTWRASKYIECWEWMMAPTRVDGSDPDPAMAPHVINNSWSCPISEGCNPETLHQAARALYAAGIAIAKSAGNAGPSCSTMTMPAYEELLSVAAFNSSDAIASFSSRGPVVWGEEPRINPDIAAPGVGVRSSIPGGGYAAWSGTSMASPHVAGLVALLWSARPDLIGDLETTYDLIKATAEGQVDLQCAPHGPGGRPNNVWGWGAIDALALVNVARNGGWGTLGGTVSAQGSGAPLPAALVTVVRADNGLRRLSRTGPAGLYSETLPAATYDVTATLYGYLPVAVGGVDVLSGTVTPLDLALPPAPLWTLSGVVQEAGSGAPLRATVALRHTPITLTTDPTGGAYSGTVAEGSYRLRVSSPGYQVEERAITITDDLSESFALQPLPTYYLRDSTDPCGPVFSWVDITASGQPYSLGDDTYQYVSLGGRQFPFFGNPYTSLYIASNGYLVFGSGSSYPGGNAIPSPFPPNNAIYPFWDDLNPAYGSQGTIYTELVGDDLFVIEFYQVEHWPSGDPETFEVLLDLESGGITLQYLTVSNSLWSSVGLENQDGSLGLAYAFHQPGRPTDTLAVAFYPVSGAHPAEQGLGMLQGTVVASPTMRPIAGATVAAWNLRSGDLLTRTTDMAGRYSATLCADLYSLTASAPGYMPAGPLPAAVYSGSLTLQDWVLEPTASCTPVWGADFAWAPPEPPVGEVVSFTASASGTAPITFTWGLGDGTLAQGAQVSHTYTLPGTYTVWMTATNCATATAVVSHTLLVASCTPVWGADFAWAPPEPPVGEVVSFTASASGTAPITFTWGLGDGTLAQGAQVSHTYTLPGTYTVVLTASNACGVAGRTRSLRVLPYGYKVYLPLIIRSAGP